MATDSFWIFSPTYQLVKEDLPAEWLPMSKHVILCVVAAGVERMRMEEDIVWYRFAWRDSCGFGEEDRWGNKDSSCGRMKTREEDEWLTSSC
jgi:hypothetical protein